MKKTAMWAIWSLVLIALVGCDGREGRVTTETETDPPPPVDAETSPPPVDADRTVAVSAEKMNVFYIGVENPVSVAAGIAPADLEVTVSGAGAAIKPAGARRYVVTVTTPGECAVHVTGGGIQGTRFTFRSKRLPDPVARLGRSSGGLMGSGEFRAQGGVGAFHDNLDFDVRSAIVGFELTYVGKRQDPVTVTNQGPRFNAKASALIRRAKPGDIYLFTNVKAKCPGDSATRRVNTMVFTIK